MAVVSKSSSTGQGQYINVNQISSEVARLYTIPFAQLPLAFMWGCLLFRPVWFALSWGNVNMLKGTVHTQTKINALRPLLPTKTVKKIRVTITMAVKEQANLWREASGTYITLYGYWPWVFDGLWRLWCLSCSCSIWFLYLILVLLEVTLQHVDLSRLAVSQLSTETYSL